MSVTVFLVMAFCFLVIRLYPIWPNRERGCDAYYFLLCARTLQKNKRLPIVLPDKFLAEYSEQWYPPFFPILLAFFPLFWLQQKHWLVNHAFDLLIAGLVFAFTVAYAGNFAASLFVLFYALQPALVNEFMSLTSRPLGMFLQILSLTFAYLYISNEHLVSGFLCVFSIALLIYAHKLSTQLVWFLFPFLSFVYWDFRWFMLLVAGYILAFIVWPTMFIKIQRAHLDIVKFWNREWSLLGAHPVNQSPIYGDTKSGTTYYRSEAVKTPFAFLKTVLQSNIFVVLIPVSLAFDIQNYGLSTFLIWWVIGIYLWVLITHFIPHFRCMGLAQQYVKFSYVPLMAYMSLFVSEIDLLWLLTIGLLFFAILFRWYFLSANVLRTAPQASASDGINDLIEYINGQEAPVVMVYPYHRADELAFRSKAKLVWGTHAYSFETVKDFFPVLKKPLNEIIEKFDVTHVVVDENYVSPLKLDVLSDMDSSKIGDFHIFKVG